MKRVVKKKTVMVEKDRLFPLVALSANQRACTLFVATRMVNIQSLYEEQLPYLGRLAQFNLAYTHPVAKFTPAAYNMLGFCRGINVLFCQISVISHTILFFTSGCKHLKPLFNYLMPFLMQKIITT